MNPLHATFFEDQAELDRAGGLGGLEAHHRRLSTRFGYTSIIVLRQLLGAWPPPAGSWTW